MSTDETETLRAFVLETLTEEGYRPKVDDDGDILFKYEGNSICLEFDHRDPGYLRWIQPIAPPPDADSSINCIHAAVNHTVERCKGVKVFLTATRGVMASVEFVIDDVSEITPTKLERHFMMLSVGDRTFNEILREIEEQDDGEASAVCH
jgi:hypothetical protein